MFVISGHISHFDNSRLTAICCSIVLRESGERKDDKTVSKAISHSEVD
jgi:hypothetical protein